MKTVENLEKTLMEAKREYQRSWRNKPENKEKAKAAQQRYWEKKALELLNKGDK